MRNFVQPANVLGIVAPKDVVSGEGVVIGAIFGIATTTQKSGTVTEFLVEGAVELAKDGGALAAGDVAKFDPAAQKVGAAGTVTIGYVYVAAVAAATVCWVKLTPHAGAVAAE
jgi:predicted RecA/RadA family phage recombinase